MAEPGTTVKLRSDAPIETFARFQAGFFSSEDLHRILEIFKDFMDFQNSHWCALIFTDFFDFYKVFMESHCVCWFSWISISLIFPQWGLPIRGSHYTPKQWVACCGVSSARVPWGCAPVGFLEPLEPGSSPQRQKSKIALGTLHCQANCAWRSELS